MRRNQNCNDDDGLEKAMPEKPAKRSRLLERARGAKEARGQQDLDSESAPQSPPAQKDRRPSTGRKTPLPRKERTEESQVFVPSSDGKTPLPGDQEVNRDTYGEAPCKPTPAGPSTATQNELAANQPGPSPDHEQSAQQPARAVSANLSDAARGYLDHLRATGKSKATLTSYQGDIEIAVQVFGQDQPLAAITPDELLRFAASEPVRKTRTGRPKAKPTIDKTCRVIRQIFEWAIEEGILERDPSRGLPLGRRGQSAP